MIKNILLILLLLGSLEGFAGGDKPQSFTYNGKEVNKTNAEGKKTGYWVILGKTKPSSGFADDAVMEEGEYDNNKKTGIWKTYYANGKLKSEIEYKNNRPNGVFKTYYENGQVEEEGNWKGTYYTGSFKRFYSNGQVAQEKNFNAAGKSEGTQKYFYENGVEELVFESKNGVENGKMVRKYPNGDVKEEKNFNGGAVVEGTEKQYAMVNPDVKVDLTPGLDNKNSTKSNDKPNEATKLVPDGYNKLYNSNKQISEDGEFKGGKLLNGKKYIYDKNGLLDKIEIYKNGKYAGDAQID